MQIIELKTLTYGRESMVQNRTSSATRYLWQFLCFLLISSFFAFQKNCSVLYLLMETKLILTDLDETLLHSDKSISDYSVKILNECKKQNILVGFCTSRGKINLTQFEQRIKPDIIICNGGACIYFNDKILFTNEFSLEETRTILQTAYIECGKNCEITLDTIDKIYWNRKKDKSTIYSYDSVFDDFSDFKIPAMKICVQTDNEQKAKKIAASIGIGACDYLPFSDIPWYKFSAKTATKEYAIKVLCEKLNISLQQVISFGDDFNDIGMLKICGKGIAMENAISQVKNVADDITKTNNEDGVAFYIEKNILN